MSVLKSIILTAAPVLGDDPLGSPESYLKYDIKKGASLDPDYEAVSIIHYIQSTSEEILGGLLERISVRMDQDRFRCQI